MVKRKIGLSVLIVILVAGLNYPVEKMKEEPGFGTKIDPIKTIDIENKTISVPEKGKVTVLLLFNIDHPPHYKLLTDLNYTYVDLVQKGKRIQFIALSKGDGQKFQKIRNSYNIQFPLVNDTENKILPMFDYSCSICYKIFVCDKECIVRYSSTNVDYYFMGKIIERYEGEKE